MINFDFIGFKVKLHIDKVISEQMIENIGFEFHSQVVVKEIP